MLNENLQSEDCEGDALAEEFAQTMRELEGAYIRYYGHKPVGMTIYQAAETYMAHDYVPIWAEDSFDVF